MPGARYDFPPFRLDAERRLLLRHGSAVPVPRKALEALVMLVEQHGEVVSKEDLLKRVWHDAYVEENSLNQSVSALRRILGDSAAQPRFIETVPGRGYRFVATIAQAPPAGSAVERGTAVRLGLGFLVEPPPIEPEVEAQKTVEPPRSAGRSRS